MTTDTTFEVLADAAAHRAELRAAADDLLAREWSAERSRDLLEADGPSWAVGLWDRLSDLGWPDLLIDGTVADLCTVAEAVGASTAALPLVTAAVARAACAPTEPLLVITVPGTLTASLRGDGAQLWGHAGLVPYADVADRFLVHARTEGGDHLMVVVPADTAGVERAALRPLDAMPSASIELHGVNVVDEAVVARGAEAAASAEETRLRLVLGWTAELTGVAAAANAAAVEYARERVAFGRPIGTFQAVKHRLVDQRAAIEVSRALVGRAATALMTGTSDRSALVALAAFWAGDALRAVPEGVVQVFGGIGYTWEHVAHVYLRRAAVLVALLGDRASHRDAAADWLRHR